MPGEYDIEIGSLFAPPSVRDDIIAALTGGATSLEVKVKSKTYNFRTRGFNEAVKPVFKACGH